MIRRSVAAIAGVLLCAGALAGCGGTGSPAAGEGGFVAGDGSTIVLAANKRGAPISLSGTTVAGKPISVSDYRGQVVVLNVWASWCAPCRAEAPGLEAGWQQWQKDGGTQVMGINTRDDRTSAAGYIATFHISYPNIFDKFGQKLLELGGTLPPNAIPSTLVLDKSGRVAARVLGPTSPALLDGIISQLKKETVA
jgi:thiol-disulfide isomerase/thioredoxin